MEKFREPRASIIFSARKGFALKKMFRMVRFTVFCFFLSLLQVMAEDSYSQQTRISLNQHNQKLEDVLKTIENKSEFFFLYNRDLINVDQTVNIDAKDQTINIILDDLLKGTDIRYSVVNRQIILSNLEGIAGLNAQQQKSVSGKVTDSSGGSLPGVSVVVKGTTIGVITDVDGKYSLSNVPEKAILQFSFVGMKTQEIAIGSKTIINVVLIEETIGIEEVVAIGYGVVKKSDLTGAVSSIGSKELSSVSTQRIDQALQGKAAGVQVTSVNGSPGAGTSIRIRGGNSISASNEPLYVIDGFIGGGDLNSINPEDIKSIEILKDASSTAIYGSRGANGVILITTKQGIAGKANITVNAYSGVQQLPKEVDLLTGPQLAQYVNERAAFFGTSPIYPDVSKITDTDWQKEITKNANIQNVNVSFSGGNDKATYYLSGNYFNQDGIILNSGFSRYQTRFNFNLKLTDWLSIGSNLNFSRSTTNNNKVNLYDILKSAPTSLPVYDLNGNYTILSPLSGSFFENPVATAKMNSNSSFNNSLQGNWYAEASFRNGLKFKSTFSINNGNSATKQYLPGSLPLRTLQKLGGYASISSSATLNILNENTVSFDKTIDKHQFNIISGYTYQHETTESFSAIGQGFTNDLLTYNNLSTGDPLLAKNSSNYSDWTILSLLGRINYAFNNKYLFTVSVREDGSSRLAKNNKYAFFPSAAFSWRMNEESFMKDLGLFSSLKFRASYGKTGNQAIAVYSTLPSLSISNAWFNNGQNIGYTLGNIPNDDLKWETTDQYNAGLDMGLIHGRLSFTFDAYYKKTYNLLLSAQIPGTTGYSSKLDNIGTVENRGLEFTFEGKILNTKMLTWDIGFNLAMNRNKVLDLGKNITYRDLTDGARLIVGQPAPVFYGAIFEGVFKSQAEIDALPNYQSGLKPGYVKFKDNNGNGKYDGLADYDIMGNPEPKFFGGLSSSLKYKRFGLNAYFNYSYGNDIINSFGPRLFAGEYASNVGKIALKRWTPENNQSNIPGVGASAAINVNSQAFSFAVQDGSFLRLKTLQLTYSLPVNKIKWLQDASIYFTGTNLFNINNYSWGFDPEVNSSGTDPVLRGFDGYTYPQNRSFILGINLKF